MKVILAIDSFKGTLSSSEVESILAEELEKAGVECIKIPIADGGEGLIDSMYPLLGGKKIKTLVFDPNGETTQAEYLLVGDTAIIETAQAAGLPKSKTTAGKATTLGVGELISDAEGMGATKFVLGLGGSATNDCGAGLAAALGVKFIDENGKTFIPVGETLEKIADIQNFKSYDITALCDVKNELYGKNGAAYVFAPQKGADPDQVEMLDKGLRHVVDLLIKLGKGSFNVSGAGAAGGMGAGVLAFLGGKLKSGIDVVLDLAGFDDIVKDADLVITGEGRLDSQSFGGKVIDGIIRRSSSTPVLAVVGLSLLDEPEKYGLKAVFETNPEHLPFESVKGTAKQDLTKCAEKIAAYIVR